MKIFASIYPVSAGPGICSLCRVGSTLGFSRYDTEHTTRQASLNEDGTLRYVPGTSHVQQNRFEYVYDSHGNWTSRTVSFRLEPESAFGLSNIERREIEYFVP